MAKRRNFRHRQLSPCSEPVVYKLWSDSNLTNFTRELADLGVKYTEEDKGTVNVYDNGPWITTLARDYGADTY